MPFRKIWEWPKQGCIVVIAPRRNGEFWKYNWPCNSDFIWIYAILPEARAEGTRGKGGYGGNRGDFSALYKVNISSQISRTPDEVTEALCTRILNFFKDSEGQDNEGSNIRRWMETTQKGGTRSCNCPQSFHRVRTTHGNNWFAWGTQRQDMRHPGYLISEDM